MRKRVSIPEDVRDTITLAVSKLIASLDWGNLPDQERQQHYSKWADDESIGGLVRPYVVDPRNYIIDTTMRRISQKRALMENIEARLKVILSPKIGGVVIETVKKKQSLSECKLLWRLPDKEFLAVVVGRATAWRHLVLGVMIWEIKVQESLKDYPKQLKSILVLLRDEGDELGNTKDIQLVKQIVQRCNIILHLVQPSSSEREVPKSSERFLFGK